MMLEFKKLQHLEKSRYLDENYQIFYVLLYTHCFADAFQIKPVLG